MQASQFSNTNRNNVERIVIGAIVLETSLRKTEKMDIFVARKLSTPLVIILIAEGTPVYWQKQKEKEKQ